MAAWEDSDDELEAFLTTRPQAPRSALIEGGSLIAAHAAQPAQRRHEAQRAPLPHKGGERGWPAVESGWTVVVVSRWNVSTRCK